MLEDVGQDIFLLRGQFRHICLFFFFQAEDGIRDLTVTGVQTCALPISSRLCFSNLLWKQFDAEAHSAHPDPEASDIFWARILEVRLDSLSQDFSCSRVPDSEGHLQIEQSRLDGG